MQPISKLLGNDTVKDFKFIDTKLQTTITPANFQLYTINIFPFMISSKQNYGIL